METDENLRLKKLNSSCENRKKKLKKEISSAAEKRMMGFLYFRKISSRKIEERTEY
ncbi:MAG TPA: hypothetical protein PLJ29_02945 [Leptospiraceae bacterium]|nr:hypothetical protein [Leptospiraceae bacterium]